MALDAHALATLMISNVATAAAGGPLPTLDPILEALAAAIVTHVTSNAVVVPTLLIAPGGLSPAPVTGTGSVT